MDSLCPHLVRPPGELIEVFHFIGSMEFGAQLIRQFREFTEQREVELRDFPPELEERFEIAGLRGPSVARGAFFVTDGDSGTIYVNASSEVAVLAPVLVHEMVHAMDSTLWGAAKQSLPKLLRERVIIDSEYRAYQAQFQFLRQIFAVHPKLKAYFEAKYPSTPALSRELTFKEIAKNYLGASSL